MWNGVYDDETTVDGVRYTTDHYGYWEVYIYYPMFYVNSADYTQVTLRKNISHNPTLDENFLLDDYDFYNEIASINTTNCSEQSLGSFVLDTITRDIEFSITITKPLEYWLHSTNSNM